MLDSPFVFEPHLTPEEYQKLGILALRWSHIDHIIGNCLRVMLRQTEQEAIVTIFSLSTQHRLEHMKKLVTVSPLNSDAQAAFDELLAIMKGIQFVRNGVVHAILLDDETEGHVFHLRSKERNLTKAEVFATEELTNYAGHAVKSLRYALGLKGSDPSTRHPLPDRPDVPEFLRHLVSARKPPRK
jgi:hypothetical protein